MTLVGANKKERYRLEILDTHGGKDVGHSYRMVDVRGLVRVLPPLLFVLDGGEVGGLDEHTRCVGHFILIFI